MKQVFLFISILFLIISCGGGGGSASSTTDSNDTSNSTSGENDGIKIQLLYSGAYENLHVNNELIPDSTTLHNQEFELIGDGYMEGFFGSAGVTIIDKQGFSTEYRLGEQKEYYRIPFNTKTYKYRYEYEFNEVLIYYYEGGTNYAYGSNQSTGLIKSYEEETPFFGFRSYKRSTSSEETQNISYLKIYKDDMLIFEKHNFTDLNIGGIDASDYLENE